MRKVFPHFSGVERFGLCVTYGIVHIIDGLAVMLTGRSPSLTYNFSKRVAKLNGRRLMNS